MSLFPLFLEKIPVFHYFMQFYFFTVTLDLKASYMFIVKLGDKTFPLGGQGIEFCFLVGIQGYRNTIFAHNLHLFFDGPRDSW